MYMPIVGIELVIVMLNSFKLLWGKKKYADQFFNAHKLK